MLYVNSVSVGLGDLPWRFLPCRDPVVLSLVFMKGTSGAFSSLKARFDPCGSRWGDSIDWCCKDGNCGIGLESTQGLENCLVRQGRPVMTHGRSLRVSFSGRKSNKLRGSWTGAWKLAAGRVADLVSTTPRRNCSGGLGS